MCREGAWAELAAQVTFRAGCSKQDARNYKKICGSASAGPFFASVQISKTYFSYALITVVCSYWFILLAVGL